MSTLHISESLIDDYVARFAQLAPRDQTILLNRLTETIKENGSPSKKYTRNVFSPQTAKRSFV